MIRSDIPPRPARRRFLLSAAFVMTLLGFGSAAIGHGDRPEPRAVPQETLTFKCVSTEYVIDGDGGAQGQAFSESEILTVPQGTDSITLTIVLFSREYPAYTGRQSQYNDLITWSATGPAGRFSSGSYRVNDLHGAFGPGANPGGNYTAYTETIDYSAWTENGDATLTLAASVTNVADNRLGSGVAFIVEGVGGLVRDVTILDPATSGWGVEDRIPGNNVILTGQPLRVLIRFLEPVNNVSELGECQLQVRVFDRQSDARQWIDLVINGDDAFWAGGQEFRLTVTSAELQALGLVPNPLLDNVTEFASADMVSTTTGESNRYDSDAFDGAAETGGRKARGRARGAGDRTAVPPEFAFASRQFLQSAGVRLVQVRAGGRTSAFEPLQDQADYFYLSAHGSSRTARLLNDANSVVLDPVTDLANGEWGQDLDCLIIAGCAVLDINDYNDNFKPPNDNPSPGLKWINAGPSILLGNNYKANLDNAGGDPRWTANIVQRFMKRVNNGTPIIFAWRDANLESPHLSTNRRSQYQRPYNACAIDLRPPGTDDDRYWYFDLTVSPPVWTSKRRADW